MKIKLCEIIKYYDSPLFYKAIEVDNPENIFICMLIDDNANDFRYVCTSISNDTFQDLMSNKISVRSIFENTKHGGLYLLVVNAKDIDEFEVTDFTEDISPYLPTDKYFIGNKEEIIKEKDIARHVQRYNFDFAANTKNLRKQKIFGSMIQNNFAPINNEIVHINRKSKLFKFTINKK
jgi:hypothetical protein